MNKGAILLCRAGYTLGFSTFFLVYRRIHALLRRYALSTLKTKVVVYGQVLKFVTQCPDAMRAAVAGSW